MNTKFYLLFLLAVFSTGVFSQTHDHEHSLNEIGIAASPVYFTKEKAFSYSIHAHYVRNILDSKFGFGVGYEIIFDDHKHRSLGIIGVYRPIQHLSLSLSPGVGFEGNFNEAHFTIHIETVYEFVIKNIHLGPTIGFAYDPEDNHINLGVHIGYGF